MSLQEGPIRSRKFSATPRTHDGMHVQAYMVIPPGKREDALIAMIPSNIMSWGVTAYASEVNAEGKRANDVAEAFIEKEKKRAMKPLISGTDSETIWGNRYHLKSRNARLVRRLRDHLQAQGFKEVIEKQPSSKTLRPRRSK